MIEVVYKDEKREAKESFGSFNIPKNIRQIGLGGGKYRIYVEDYVYTFMNRLAEKSEEEKGGLAVLTGKAEWNEGVTYIFIKGAVYLDTLVNTEHISMADESWEKIQETCEKYFREMEIVGWFLTMPQLSMEVTEVIARNHLKYFGGIEKIFMLMDPQEKEEAFFYYENGRFVKTPGYYLYYEKNPKMQEYMTDHKWWEISENKKVIPDEAVKNFRKKIAKKAEKTEAFNEKPSIFSHAATACLVIAVLLTGANFVKNYQQIQNTEQELEASAVFTVDDQIETVRSSADIAPPTEVPDEEKIIDEASDDTEREEKEDTEINQENTDTTEGDDTLEESTEDIAEESEKESETASTDIFNTYMIRPGDTLYRISILNYGNTEIVPEICRLNNISEEEKIYPGQIIVLP